MRVGESCGFHLAQKLRGSGESVDGFRKIFVGAGLAVERATDGGKNAAEIELVELAEEAIRLAEVEDADLAAGTEDARELTQAGVVVGEIAEAEGGGDEIDGGVGER